MFGQCQVSTAKKSSGDISDVLTAAGERHRHLVVAAALATGLLLAGGTIERSETSPEAGRGMNTTVSDEDGQAEHGDTDTTEPDYDGEHSSEAESAALAFYTSVDQADVDFWAN